MKKFGLFSLMAALGVAACDLQPKIASLPDSVGEFIYERYPALLADPTTQPEIYNSAASDYGVYASPELYGTSSTDDYVLYASVDDYIVPPQAVEDSESTGEDSSDAGVDDKTDKPNFASDDVLVVPERAAETDDTEPDAESTDDDIAWDEHTTTDDTLNIPMYGGDAYTEITVVSGDTLYMLGKKYNMTVDELAQLNNLSEPYRLSVGQKLRVRVSAEQVVADAPKVPEQKQIQQKPQVKTTTKPIQKVQPQPVPNTTTRVAVNEITVVPGDTLYSLSRKYSVPVNDLAVMNNLNVPFALYAGQKLKVPDLASAPVRESVKMASKPINKTEKQTNTPKSKTVAKDSEKYASKPKQQPQENKKQSGVATKSTKQAPAKKTEIVARSSSKFSWPVRGKILSDYGAKSSGLFNDGINISATLGTKVVAAENGVVAYAGNEVKGMGNLVIIQHSDGWMTVYAHMDSLGVRRGTRVAVGQKIGTVGKTGKVDKPQLHFEVRKGTKAYNPIQYLK